MSTGVTLDSFDHVGLVVKDAKAASESWTSLLGINDWKFTDAGALTLVHGTVGNVQFELIAPVEGKESLWATFLAEQGEGLHHICARVADVDDAAAKLEAEGGEIMVRIPKHMAYVNMSGPGGVILELLKTP